MRGSCRAVVVILAGVLALVVGLGVATAQVPVQPERTTTLALTVHQTSVGETSETNVRSANGSTQSASATDLAPSPPSGTMTYSAWVAVAAFVLGVIGLIVAAVLLRRLED